MVQVNAPSSVPRAVAFHSKINSSVLSLIQNSIVASGPITTSAALSNQTISVSISTLTSSSPFTGSKLSIPANVVETFQ
jgi:hypothetical protein